LNDLVKTADSSISTVGPTPGASLPAQQAQGGFLEFLDRAARDPSVDVDKMTALLNMQERVLLKQAEAEFNAAFTAMSAELGPIKKTKPVVIKGVHQYDYAPWEEIHRQIAPVLQRHGFSLSFDSQQRSGDGGGMVVTGTLLHSAGHKRSASIPLGIENSGSKNNVQGMGSTLSYGQRYTAKMLLNLIFVGEDDDGAAGGTAYISRDDAKEIEDLIAETKSDRVSFLRHFEIDDVAEMQVKQFAAARNLLMQKKAKAAGARG
jgi:hypothetical protein